MENKIEVFRKRWDTVTNETLSSVRRQLQNGTFDVSVVNRDFRESCAEWFDGKLAPRIWFQQMEEENSEVAQNFKKYVTGIRIGEVSVLKPAQGWSYVVTALSLPVCYFVLGWLTEMGMVSKAGFTIGFAVVVWYSCQLFVRKKQVSYEEQVVDLYRHQLEEHFKEMMRILS